MTSVLLFSCWIVQVQADSQANGSSAAFTVKANLPDNQIDKDNSYYQLKMSPGKRQTVTATVYNVSSKSTTIHINVTPATTTPSGTIDYSTTLKHWDSSLKNNISDIVSYPKSVTIPAGQSKEVSFDITMPDEGYQGIVLGGITFTQDKKSTSKANQNAAIQNQFASAIAMVLKEVDTEVSPQVNLINVKPDQTNGYNQITVQLQNNQPLIMSKVKVKAKIYASNAKKAVYTAERSNMQLAPNSLFNYPISLQGTPLKAGHYRAEVTVTGTAYKSPKTWQFTKNFQVKSSEAKTLNQSSVDTSANTNDHTMLLIICGFVVLIIIIIVLIVLLLKKKRQ